MCGDTLICLLAIFFANRRCYKMNEQRAKTRWVKKDMMEWAQRKTFGDNKSPMPFHSPFYTVCLCMCVCVSVYISCINETQTFVVEDGISSNSTCQRWRFSVFCRVNDFFMGTIGIWLNRLNIANTSDAPPHFLTFSFPLFCESLHIIFFSSSTFIRRLLPFVACLFAGLLVYG